ncbi:hypothetical protein EYB53_006870 [Candidatus Chloroploca sp. M-50]|uniref:Uncharacterized protein n=1 Tax=Candidatus Chloroploca mongolica TaxID=2528176 RepID=A0ABS4D7J9_9CHLR|nr:hypothetical protein [Candidatus Chloroploca mongolica]MBP1465424.1 hypothetical protein [Candidatus Chloroploca mongolica]
MSLLRDVKRLFAVMLAGVCGVIVLMDFAGGEGALAALATLLVGWAAVLTAVALLLGIVSVAGHHVGRVRQQHNDWRYSLVLLVGMLVMLVAGIFFPLPGRGGLVLPANLAEVPIRTVFRVVYEPVASSLLALLTFFSLSAALRSVQQRRGEAIVMIVVAALALLAQLPVLAAIPTIGGTLQWLNDVVAVAGARGLVIGAALGALVAGVRVLLGFDTPYLDR